MSRQEVLVLTRLAGPNRTIITLADIQERAVSYERAKVLAHELVEKQWLDRQRPGLYLIVPLAAGEAGEYTDHEFAVVGGYAVSAFQHRFSVDADLVVRDDDVEEFVDVLEANGFEAVEDRELDVYGGRYLAYEKDVKLPVTVDLLVNSLQCRQTDAAWRYDYFEQHAVTAEIEGSERSVEVRIPEKELLVAVKLHSGRLTDARDAVALAEDFDLAALEHHLDRGDREKLEGVLEQVAETISSEDFEDAFKGVFSRQTLPEEDIRELWEFIKDRIG